MAVSIPERIRGNPGIPKERQLVGGALVADLDEAATVWYEPPFDLDDARPHFLVLEPSIAVAEAVQRRLRADTPARSIAVLYLDGRTDDRAERLDQRLREIVPDLLWSNAMRAPGSADPKELLGSTESPVVLSTIHSAKGLEFPAVIVCGLGGRPGSGATRLRQDRRTLYVGLTRAQDDLEVVVRSDDMFLVDIHSAASTD